MATDGPIYNLFIAHNWEPNEHLHKITEQLDRMQNMDSRFTYLNQADFGKAEFGKYSDEDLKIAYREQITGADVVMLLTDLYVLNDGYKKWLDFALECADEMNIPTLAIRSFNNKQVPARLKEHADDVVFYYTEEIMNAIKSYS